jgi:hypothetical protein
VIMVDRMEVTGKGGADSTTQSRNEQIKADLGEYAREEAANERIVKTFYGGDRKKAAAAAGARYLKNSSYSCTGYGGPGSVEKCEHIFVDGDVVYRFRQHWFDEARWEIETRCGRCVGDESGKWAESAQPCAGGCGVSVVTLYRSGGFERIRTCSKRCAKRAEAERRRVKHEVRRCEVCEEAFTPTRSDARYCSSACRQDAYRKRKLVAA